MSHVALKCPDCGRLTTYNGRGSWRCGSYLIHHFKGSVYIDPERKTWDMSDEDNPLLIEPAPMGSIRQIRNRRIRVS